MERLTKNVLYFENSQSVNDKKLCVKAFNKLSNLEYLEEQLGCPLEVVFKALKERYVIFKHVIGVDNPIINLETHKVLGLICICEKFGLELYDGVGDEFYVDTKDYCKTWWLCENGED